MPAIYQADCWCDSCAEWIKTNLAFENKVPDDPDNERTYDSGEWPKYMPEDEESDTPQHCAALAKCLEAEELSDGSKVGALLSTNLTDEGVQYVREYILEGGVVAEWWRERFEGAGYNFSLESNDADI